MANFMMKNNELSRFEPLFNEFIRREMVTDAAHNLQHVQRVVVCARRLAEQEQADLAVVVPAAYLHDCFTYPKDHPQRRQSSLQAAEKACAFLAEIHYPAELLPAIHHAIAAHSYSAGLAAQTLEAKIVQDADRLDGLGAIGIARCIITGTSFNSELYADDDPFCQQRPPDDKQYIIDHFFTKLYATVDTMHTSAARTEALARKAMMEQFIAQLAHEIGETTDLAHSADGSSVTEV